MCIRLAPQVTPIPKRQPRKAKRRPDEAVLSAIREGGCIIAFLYGETQDTRTEADHEQQNGVRGPDCEAIPLSARLHREKHSGGKATFYAKYGTHAFLLAADRNRRQRP